MDFENSVIKKRKKNYYYMIFFLVFTFGFLLSYFGVSEYPDTQSYLGMETKREPVYPVLLNLFRLILGNVYYKIGVGIFQSILAVFSIFMFVCFVEKEFVLKRIYTWLVLLCMMAPYTVVIFFTSSKLIITNALLTEGITLSLFYVFLRFLLGSIFDEDRRNKSIVLSGLVIFLLTLVKSQMLIFFIVWMLVIAYNFLNKRMIKKAISVFIVCALLFGMRSFLIRTYNFIANGVFKGNDFGAVTITTNMLYVADESDGEYIQDIQIRQLFENIYKQIDKAALNEKAAPKLFSEKVYVHDASHDNIKYKIYHPLIKQYLVSIDNFDRYHGEAVDEIAKEIGSGIVEGCFARWLKWCFIEMIGGLIRSIAVVHPLLNWFALIAYMCAILLSIYDWKLHKGSKAVIFMSVIILMIVGNSCGTALTIMCLSRYMIYTIPLFYIGLLLVMLDIRTSRKQDKQYRYTT